jgi:hypothetical protein
MNESSSCSAPRTAIDSSTLPRVFTHATSELSVDSSCVLSSILSISPGEHEPQPVNSLGC